jgi:large subunit ribosomal protein L24
MKWKIKRDAEVVIIAGNYKGQRGKVLKVLREKQQVVVEGVNKRKKYLKKSQDNPNGKMIEIEMPVHYSNVCLVETEKK